MKGLQSSAPSASLRARLRVMPCKARCESRAEAGLWYHAVMGDALAKRLKQRRFDSPAQEALLNIMVAADHVRRAMAQTCEAHGITGPQYNVLRILRGAHPEGHSRCAIAERMIEQAPDVTRLLDRLESQGLVARDRSAADKRQSIARITADGLALLARMEPVIQGFHASFAQRLSPDEFRELSRLCEALYGDA